MILALPGQTERVDVEPLVLLIDVAPTLVELVGGSLPPSFEGQSRKDALVADSSRSSSQARDPAQPTNPARSGTVYTELIKAPERDAKRFTPHAHAVVSGTRKLIVGIHGEREYYDLAADPGESNAQALTEGQRLDMEHTYERIRTRTMEHAAPRDTQALDEETKERMRALGYAP